MERKLSLVSRLREVLIDGQWIANTNFKAQIQSVDWQQATHKIGSLNTIAALTFHINYYLDGILNVFIGGELEIKDQYSFDMPLIQSPADWEELVDTFIRNAERFADGVAQLPEELLDRPFVEEKYGSYLRNIEGVIEHSYYHLGQVSLIKKMI
ncbi:MAG: DinB family protein, partial [Pedobacter sp.]